MTFDDGFSSLFLSSFGLVHNKSNIKYDIAGGSSIAHYEDVARESAAISSYGIIMYMRMQHVHFVFAAGRRTPRPQAVLRPRVAAVMAMAAFRDLVHNKRDSFIKILEANSLIEPWQLAYAVGTDESPDQAWLDLVAQLTTYDQSALFQDLQDFEEVLGAARRAQAWSSRRHARLPPEDIEVQLESKRRKKDAERVEQRLLGVGAPAHLASAPPLPAAPTRRRTALGPVTRAGTDQPSAAGAEADLRRRYTDELVDILISLDGPSVAHARQTADVRAALRLAAGGRRARTLRARLRAWKAFAGWLATAHGEKWPTTWTRVLDYGQVRADEPCGRQTLLGLFTAVRFIEVAAGYGVDRQITTSSLYELATKELLTAVAARAGGGGPAPANRPLVAQMLWLERTVVDEEVRPWIRAYCHWKLVQVWAALRFDDHRGLAVKDFEMVDGALVGKLGRTKTTGKDKPVVFRVFSISREAYLEFPAWIAVGVELWRQLGPVDRDYLLTAPSPDLAAGQARELTYAAAAGWSRALVTQWLSGLGAQELGETVGRHYTEHSGRGWLVSAAQALGAAEDQLEVVGGWRSKSSRSYMRSVGPKMRLIQAEVAQVVRGQLGGIDVIGERGLLADLRRLILARGHESEVVEGLLQDLTTFPTPSDDRKRWSGDGTVDEDRVGAGGTVGSQPRDDGAESREAASWLTKDGRLPAGVHGYVVSIGRKSGFRRLHLIGRCHRIPGIDYTLFEELGSQMPPPAWYDGVCGQCWRGGRGAPSEPALGSAGGTASSSTGAAVGGEALAVARSGEPTDASECSVDDSSSTDA